MTELFKDQPTAVREIAELILSRNGQTLGECDILAVAKECVAIMGGPWEGDDEGPQPPAPPRLIDRIIKLRVRIEREVTKVETATVLLHINPAVVSEKCLDANGWVCWTKMFDALLVLAEGVANSSKTAWHTGQHEVRASIAGDTNIIYRACHEPGELKEPPA